MFRVCTLSILLVLLVFPLKSFGLTTHDLECESAKIEWTAGDNLVEWHEIRTVFNDAEFPEYSEVFAVLMPKLSAVVPRPRSGHCDIEVRACRNITTPECSSWTNSSVSGVANGVLSPWEVFWEPLAPSGIEIE